MTSNLDLILEAAQMIKDCREEEMTDSTVPSSSDMTHSGDEGQEVEEEREGEGDLEEEYIMESEELSIESSRNDESPGTVIRKRSGRGKAQSFLKRDFHSKTAKPQMEQSNEKHNENERKRRKVMKQSVHTLREQLRRKTRRPALNSVLKAAYDEIQELKQTEKDQSKCLEEQKQKNIILNCLLEKLMKDIKHQRTMQTTSDQQKKQSNESDSPHTSASPVTFTSPITSPIHDAGERRGTLDSIVTHNTTSSTNWHWPSTRHPTVSPLIPSTPSLFSHTAPPYTNTYSPVLPTTPPTYFQFRYPYPYSPTSFSPSPFFYSSLLVHSQPPPPILSRPPLLRSLVSNGFSTFNETSEHCPQTKADDHKSENKVSQDNSEVYHVQNGHCHGVITIDDQRKQNFNCTSPQSSHIKDNVKINGKRNGKEFEALSKRVQPIMTDTIANNETTSNKSKRRRGTINGQHKEHPLSSFATTKKQSLISSIPAQPQTSYSFMNCTTSEIS